ncbi:MAG: hypothetical protein JETCAE01_28240 [Anaerolineaceae bacterium]|nr:MAG: hypothetical protein JETCAE01_28240 [Anaerolineaceae bacterium]
MKRPFILLLALSISFSILACGRGIIPQDPSVNAEAPEPPKPVEKTLSTFNPIQGTDYLMAGIVPIELTRDASLNPFEWISSSGYSGYSAYATYNYVFFNTQTEEYHRLLPDNNSIIFQTAGFPQLVYDPNDPEKPAPVIEFWMFNIIKADTNGDGYFDYRDKLTIGIADVSGANYTELIANVDAIQSQYYKDPSNFFIIYNVNEKNFIAKVNPITRAIVSTTEMDLGEDVK